MLKEFSADASWVRCLGLLQVMGPVSSYNPGLPGKAGAGFVYLSTESVFLVNVSKA